MNNRIYTLGDGIGYVDLVLSAGGDRSIINAARVSYSKDEDAGKPLTERDLGLLNYLIEHGHFSPFQHNLLQFVIKCPIFVARQFMRHHVGWSYNELSRRYTSDDIEVYVPKYIREQSKSNKQASGGAVEEDLGQFSWMLFTRAANDAVNTYNSLVKYGVARELARSVLPQGTYTRFYATTNLRALLHFADERSQDDAQWEIRKYSDAMLELAEQVFPESITMYRELYS